MKSNQSGNVLFLILIAVALFAALSYAVTQSSRGGGNADNEISLINSATLIQYAGQIEQSIQRLRLINGCSEADITFHDSRWGHAHYQHTPASSDECNVFHTDGGGVTFPTDVSDVAGLPWEFEGGNDLGDGVNRLMMLLPGISLGMCNTINDQLGLGWSSPPVDNGSVIDVADGSARFVGSYAGGAAFDSFQAIRLIMIVAQHSRYVTPTQLVFKKKRVTNITFFIM